MKSRQDMQVRVIAGGIAFVLLLYPFASAQEPIPPQVTSNPSPTGIPASSQTDAADKAAARSTTQSSGAELPDSPGTVQARPSQPPAETPSSAQAPQSNDQVPDMPGAMRPANNQVIAQASGQAQQQQAPHEPLGTAAAESVPTTGVAASRPAGAAVAPAKQRRVRSILIKVGALVGAGVAVGTAMALSQGSPSKPPGSH